MLTKVLDWVVGREPVAAATGVAGGVGAILGVLLAFDVVEFDAEQIAAIGAFAAWAAGWLARKAVSPVQRPSAPGALVGGTPGTAPSQRS